MPAEYTRTTTSLLSIKHVSLSLGGRLILRDVNAEIDNLTRTEVTGQVICFLGPSGIGKTQLSRVIAGLQRPSAGSLTLYENIPVHRGGVGMVPQNYPLFEYLTVEGNLRVAGEQSTVKDIHAKSRDLMSQFDLEEYRQMYPSQLSGGTRQRVAIARQLMCAEHYMVMDEPFSGLDPVMKNKAGEAILKLASLDDLNTVIIVTHDVAFGCSVADTVWLMGQEQDEQGKFLPGSRIVTQYDLAAMGFCWRPGIRQDPQFQSLVAELEFRFNTLKKFD